MYCPQCRIEYVGWRGKCPDCKMDLEDENSQEPVTAGTALPYNALVDLVRKNNGRISIEMTTREVERQKKWGFPYLGYGYAWVKRFQGNSNGILVDLTTTETGRQRKWTFPFFGFGLAWEETVKGSIAGNELTLNAKKISRKRKWDFPWLGYGFAWTEEMTGECGAELTVRMTITNVNRKTVWAFPYLGYGFAWARSARLELSHH